MTIDVLKVYKGGSRSLHYRVKSSRSEVFNIITDVFNNYLPSWEALPSGLGLGVSWNLLWTWSKPRINMTHLLVWQRVNHFEDSKQLTRKDLLKRNLQRYTGTVNIANYAFGCNSSTASTGRSKAAESFEIMPLTFLLPHEYTQFVQAFTTLQMLHNEQQNEASANNGKSAYAPFQNFWIMKPIGLSRGRGIKMIRDVGELAYSQASVVQKYIERPLCLNNYKFDLRIYVIVTSFKPLEAFIYKDGFARVSTLQYSLNPDDTNNLFIHLTNSSIQKHNLEGHAKDSPLYDKNDNYNTGEVGGSKISLLGPQGLWNRLKKEKIDTDSVWQGICAVVIKSLVVVDDKMNHQPCCFELFGYDVLIDQDLRSWLIEVNASPSLARENHIDKRVKNNLIKDIVQLLNPATYDRAALARILRRRLANIAKNKASMGKNDTELETDLRDILGDYLPRKYGEAPEVMGNFEMLCPETKLFSNIVKLKNKLFKASTN